MNSALDSNFISPLIQALTLVFDLIEYMHIQRLELSQFRNHGDSVWEPAPGMNVLLGSNAAGKTSLLEAIHVMSYGKSFRCRLNEGLIQRGHSIFKIYVEWNELVDDWGGKKRRAGLQYGRPTWVAKLDGQSVKHLAQLCAALRVVTFEPGSHSLISGSSQFRRRYVDWGLFHVEHNFWSVWRRYAKALKHRNTLLKQKASISLLEAWEMELADAGELLTTLRSAYLARLKERLLAVATKIAPGLELETVSFFPGWKCDDYSLQEALILSRVRDLQLGHTTVGPHRADWQAGLASGVAGQALSRGQAKMAALSSLLAQASDLAEQCGDWPILLFDDLVSELDRNHQARVIDYLSACPAQVLITSTDVPQWDSQHKETCAWFHVEQNGGQVDIVRKAD